MKDRRSLAWAPVAGVAGVGVLVGHWLAYSSDITNSSDRARLLAQTGHSYWELAVKIAVVLLLAGLGAVVSGHLGRGGRPSPRTPLSLLCARLIGLQVVVFTAMEVVERIVAGAPVGQLFAHSLFLLGVAVQVLVAVAGALFLRLFDRAVELAVATPAGGAKGRARTLWSRRPAPVLRVPVLAGATGLRSPPRSSH